MNIQQKITPHLWFDKEAREAADFYVSIFDNSKIKSSNVLNDTPSGSVDILTIELANQEFSLISAGPYFKFNPSISFFVPCKNIEEVEKLWAKLAEGGSPLMDLGKYPFSEKYGWTKDKYGVSWQIMFMGDRPMPEQKIIPTLMFVGGAPGKAKEAIEFYTATFRNAKINHIVPYEKNDAPDMEGMVKHASFVLENEIFAAMDGGEKHNFTFSEAISFIIHCDNQEEIDYYWEKLSAVPEAEQCGWLKDKYGVSWQIVPTIMNKLFASGNKEKLAKVTKAFLQMKKFDIKKLEEAGS